MAKNDVINMMVKGGILFAGGYVIYQILRTDSAGPVGGTIGKTIGCFFNPEKCLNVTPIGPKPTPSPGPMPGGGCQGTGNEGWMTASDPNIYAHIDEWQRAVGPGRKYNWAEFAQHEFDITKWFHPGSNPPPYFCR